MGLLLLGRDPMNFGTCVREVIGLDFAQQHRAFDSLGLGKLRGFALPPRIRSA